jgi:hypothetical protein
MSNPFIGTLLTGATLSGVKAGTATTSTTAGKAAVLSTAGGLRAVSASVRVDLGGEPSKAIILRGGKEVETPTVNLERASAILENFIPVPRLTEPRAVSQSIVAGTLVTRGTAVDLEFLQPDRVTLGLFEGVHADLRARSVLDLGPLLQDPEIVPLLGKQASELTAAESQNLTAKLGQFNVGVDNTAPDRSLGAALAGLKSANAFR